MIEKLSKQPEDRWWCVTKMFYLSEGKSKPEASAETIYHSFWKSMELPAWAYELVRRLPNVDDSLPRETLEQIERMPPFPQLSVTHRRALQTAVNDFLRRRPIVRFPKDGTFTPHDGYSQPISIDLLASEDELRKMLSNFIEAESVRAGIDRAKVNGDRRRNRKNKLGNWRMVELLSRHKGKNQLPLNPTERSNRRNAKRYAREFRLVVLTAMRLADAGKVEQLVIPVNAPVDFRLAGRRFTLAEVQRAIHRAQNPTRSRPRKNHPDKTA
jgi:hypothetical protein